MPHLQDVVMEAFLMAKGCHGLLSTCSGESVDWEQLNTRSFQVLECLGRCRLPQWRQFSVRQHFVLSWHPHIPVLSRLGLVWGKMKWQEYVYTVVLLLLIIGFIILIFFGVIIIVTINATAIVVVTIISRISTIDMQSLCTYVKSILLTDLH